MLSAGANIDYLLASALLPAFAKAAIGAMDAANGSLEGDAGRRGVMARVEQLLQVGGGG
jgi:hypothetical protein